MKTSRFPRARRLVAGRIAGSTFLNDNEYHLMNF